MGDQAIGRDAGSRWTDPHLRRAARGTVALPLVTSERSRRDQHRRILAFALATALAVALANAVVLTLAGIMPGLRDPEIRGPDSSEAAVIVLLVVPVVAAFVLYGILWLAALWGVRDTDGHPWRYEVTTDALAVTQADGTRVTAPWPRWRYEGYSYRQYKGAALVVSALHLSLDGRALTIDFFRTRRPRRLARAVLQQLAAHGRAEG
jgi:hypothetical protein